MKAIAVHHPSPSVEVGQLIRNAQSGFASGERSAIGTVQLRMNNVTTDGILDWSSYIRVPATDKQVQNYSLQPGDVLFNSTNSPELVGKTIVFPGFQEPVVFSNHFLRLRVDDERLDSRYLAHWITVQWQKRIFAQLATQWVNQASVRREDLLGLQIPLPPLPEQQRIAGILRRADRLRRLRRYALEMSDGYLQAVFLEMFGDPATNPMGWEVKSLAQIKAKFAYGTSARCTSESEGLPVLRIPNVLSRQIDLSDLKYAVLDARETEMLTLRKGDVLFVRTNGNPDYVGRCAVFDLPGRYLFASYLIRARINHEVIDPWYLDTLLRTTAGRDAMAPFIRTTAGQSNIGMEGLGQIPVPLPPTRIQEKFRKIVRSEQRVRVQQREALRQAEHLFQTLLHGAFRGEG